MRAWVLTHLTMIAHSSSLQSLFYNKSQILAACFRTIDFSRSLLLIKSWQLIQSFLLLRSKKWNKQVVLEEAASKIINSNQFRIQETWSNWKRLLRLSKNSMKTPIILCPKIWKPMNRIQEKRLEKPNASRQLRLQSSERSRSNFWKDRLMIKRTKISSKTRNKESSF